MAATRAPHPRRSAVVGLVCVIWLGAGALAAGCGSSSDASVMASRRTAPLYTEQGAAAVAEGMLAAVRVPATARRVAAPPPSVAQRLKRSSNSENSPKSVDRHAFWISTEGPKALLAFLAAHAPGKLYSSGYGGTAGRTEGWW